MLGEVSAEEVSALQGPGKQVLEPERKKPDSFNVSTVPSTDKYYCHYASRQRKNKGPGPLLTVGNEVTLESRGNKLITGRCHVAKEKDKVV